MIHFFLISEQGLTIYDFRSMFDFFLLIQHSFVNQKSLIFIRKSFFFLTIKTGCELIHYY